MNTKLKSHKNCLAHTSQLVCLRPTERVSISAPGPCTYKIWEAKFKNKSDANLFKVRMSISPSMLAFSNLYLTRNSTLSLSIAVRQHLSHSAHFQILKLRSLKPDNFNSFRAFFADPFRLRAYESDGAVHKDVAEDFNLDSLLSQAELLCLLSSAILSVCFEVNSVIAGSKEFVVAIGNKVVLWGVLKLVGGVVIEAWIRRRQWRRICRETHKEGLEVNLLEQVEKLKEDLKSSVAFVRVLSRQLEKLGIRFWVTRKGLKDPITETAALAQKNSEATRALVARSDILKQELGEIQKVLLAMQEQQQNNLIWFLLLGGPVNYRKANWKLVRYKTNWKLLSQIRMR